MAIPNPKEQTELESNNLQNAKYIESTIKACMEQSKSFVVINNKAMIYLFGYV